MRKTVRRIGVVLALILITASVTASAAELTVAYTANSSGKLTACSCPGDPYGGLAERVTLVKKLRKEEKNLLLLDAGNMVSLFGDYDVRAACIMRLMNLMGYAAAGVGRQELFRNAPPALAMSRVARFPFLSATVLSAKGGEPVFRPYAILKAGKTTVGVTAISDSSAYFPELNRPFDYTLRPVEQALGPILAELRGKVDFIIVLSHMEPGRSERLLERFPGVDLVIQGYGNRELEKPKPVARGFLAAPGDRGQYVGLIRLEKNGGGASVLKRGELIPVLDIDQDKKAMGLVKEYYRKRK